MRDAADMESPSHPSPSEPSRGARVTTALVFTAIVTVAVILSFTSRKEHRTQGSYSFDPQSPLVVDAEWGDVHVHGTTTTTMAVSQDVRWSGPDGPVAPTVSEGTLLLPGCDVPWWKTIVTFAPCRADYDLSVPSSQPLDLTVEVGGVRIDGTFDGARVDLGAGDLSMDGITTDDLTVTSGVGSVEISFATPPSSVAIDSGVGDVTLLLPAGRYDIKTDAGIGSTTVDSSLVDQRSPKIISVRAGVGSIRVGAAS